MIWDEACWDRRVLDGYRRLIGWRKAHPALRRGLFEPLLAFDRVLAYRRVYEDDEAIVVLNAGGAVMDLAIPTRSGTQRWRELWSGREVMAAEGTMALHCVPAVSFAVWVEGGRD